MIVGFHGKIGSGKDVAGARLAELVDLPSQRLSFAAKLKASAAALFDIDPVEWETYKNDPEVKVLLTVGYKPAMYLVEEGKAPVKVEDIEEPNVIREFTAREILQRYGTEAHREIFGDNFWVDQALADYRHSQSELFYLTDVRFPSEAIAVRSLGGIVIRVIGENDDTGNHASEAGLPEELVNLWIDNSIRDDEFAHLDEQLRGIAGMLGLPLKELSRSE